MTISSVLTDHPRPSASALGARAQLTRQIKQSGLLNRRPGYYSLKIVLTVLGFAAGWTAFAVIGASWWTLLVAALLGVAYTQVAFLGHDAGHRQIFASRRANYRLGVLLGNLGVGMSYGWWIDKHTRHHTHPNEVGVDPDIAVGALVFTGAQAQARGRAGRWLSRNQAYLFFPLLLLEGLNLHVAGLRALSGPAITSRRDRITEVALFTLHVGGYLTALLLVLTPWQALAFLAVHQALFGLYMGCSFAPNHKGMPVLTGDEELDYVRRQVLTARNVHGNRVTDFLLGGLNYQVEHHLFPNMPRPNLRRAHPLIRRFCTEHGIPFNETGLLTSYRLVLHHLREVGRPPNLAASRPVRRSVVASFEARGSHRWLQEVASDRRQDW
jgi:fatty acid desaturase